jgi:hypothetical protein
VTCRSAIRKKRSTAFTLQQWLRERVRCYVARTIAILLKNKIARNVDSSDYKQQTGKYTFTALFHFKFARLACRSLCDSNATDLPLYVHRNTEGHASPRMAWRPVNMGDATHSTAGQEHSAVKGCVHKTSAVTTRQLLRHTCYADGVNTSVCVHADGMVDSECLWHNN